MTNNMIRFLPEVTIDNTVYSVAKPSPGHTALGDLQIRWGSAERTNAPDAALATISIWNPDPQKIWDLSLIGRQIIIRAVPAPGVTESPFTIFNGVVTDQSMSRKSKRRGSNDTYGGLICQVTAADIRTQLANTICNIASMPRESSTDRATRILAQFTDTYGQLTGGHALPTFGWGVGDIDAVQSAGRSLADLLDEAYLTYASNWSYSPHSKSILRLSLNALDAPLNFQLDRVGGELIIQVVNDYMSGPEADAAIPGRYCTYGQNLTRSAASEVSQIDVTHKYPVGGQSNGASEDRSVTLRSTMPTAPFTASSARFDTQALGTNLPRWIAINIMSLYDQLRESWEYPEISYREDLAGGFVSRSAAQQLLQSKQTNERIYVTGSWFNRFNTAPVCFVFVGGATSWDGKHWVSTIQPLPMTKAMGYQTPVSWNDLAPTGKTQMHWATPGRRMHDSVTWEDLRFVSKRSS